MADTGLRGERHAVTRHRRQGQFLEEDIPVPLHHTGCIAHGKCHAGFALDLAALAELHRQPEVVDARAVLDTDVQVPGAVQCRQEVPPAG